MQQMLYMGPKNEEPITEVSNQMDFHHMAPESREQRASPLQFSLLLTSNSKPRNILSAFYRVEKVGEYTTVFTYCKSMLYIEGEPLL